MQNNFKKRMEILSTVLHMRLGIEQLIIHPLLNAIWILLLVILSYSFSAYTLWFNDYSTEMIPNKLFSIASGTLLIILSVLIPIATVMGIASLSARFDEENVSFVFRSSSKKESFHILLSKRTDRHNKVTTRVFYTTTPLSDWQDHVNELSDRLNISIIGDITYYKNFGNRITFKSIPDRVPKNRGAIYDNI